MKQIGGRVEISDMLLYNSISLKTVLDMMNKDLGVKIGLKIIEEMKDDIIIRRQFHPGDPFYRPGITEYEARVWLITDNEAREYQKLKAYAKEKGIEL